MTKAPVSVVKPVVDGGVAARSVKLMNGPLSYIGVFIKAMPDLW